jgi:AcrR family transcriptional regulator
MSSKGKPLPKPARTPAPTSLPTPVPTLRERTRLAAQRDIGDAAMRLFLEHGFAEVTVDQIAAEAGISARSFFRYFATKEDAVVGQLAQEGLRLKAALEARPADEAPWDALRAAFDTLLGDYYDGAPEMLRRTLRMLHGTPSLRARHMEKQLHWQELLVPDVARRLGAGPFAGPSAGGGARSEAAGSGPSSGSASGADAEPGSGDVRAHALVASALACLDAAAAAWARTDDDTPIEAFLDSAITTVRGY